METLVIHYVFSLKIRGSLVIHYDFGNSGGICSSLQVLFHYLYVLSTAHINIKVPVYTYSYVNHWIDYWYSTAVNAVSPTSTCIL